MCEKLDSEPLFFAPQPTTRTGGTLFTLEHLFVMSENSDTSSGLLSVVDIRAVSAVSRRADPVPHEFKTSIWGHQWFKSKRCLFGESPT